MSLFVADSAWPLPSAVADADLALVGEPLASVLAEAQARWEYDQAKQWHASCVAEFVDALRASLQGHAALQAMIQKLEDTDATKAASTEAKYKFHRQRFRKFADVGRLADGTCLSALPAPPELVAQFLLEDLTAGRSYPAIKQAASAIRDAHVSNDMADPTQALVVRAVIRLARHQRVQHQQQVSEANPEGS